MHIIIVVLRTRKENMLRSKFLHYYCLFQLNMPIPPSILCILMVHRFPSGNNVVLWCRMNGSYAFRFFLLNLKVNVCQNG